MADGDREVESGMRGGIMQTMRGFEVGGFGVSAIGALGTGIHGAFLLPAVWWVGF